MNELLAGAIIEAVKLSPAIGVLLWVAWRSDQRAQSCMEKLFEVLDGLASGRRE
ncbi:MAG: hypothetical protein KAI25_14815 [Hyphomicrobiaceae bacterium]|nr:hypothetical protein [Hyphomicrobiaceae bacterium]